MRARLLISVSSVLAGLATTPSLADIDCCLPVKPEIDLEGAPRVAVLDLSGTDEVGVAAGRAVSQVIIGQLRRDQRVQEKSDFMNFLSSAECKNVFVEGFSANILEVMERGQLSKILQQQKIESGDYVADNTAIEVGKLLGVPIVLYGSVTVATSEEKDDGGLLTKIELPGGEGPRMKRTVELSADVRLAYVESGRVITAFSATEKSSNSGSPPSSFEVIARECADKMSSGLANKFAPYYKREKLELERLDDDLRDLGDQARDLAEDEDDLLGAYEIYCRLSAIPENEYNDKLAYNLGVLKEAGGDFEGALAEYSYAREIDDRRTYRRAIDRLEEERLPLLEYLSQWDVALRTPPFPSLDECAGEPVPNRLVTLRGGSDDRVAVYQGPAIDDGPSMVPGGITVEVVAEADDFVEITWSTSRGTKSGYVLREVIDG